MPSCQCLIVGTSPQLISGLDRWMALDPSTGVWQEQVRSAPPPSGSGRPVPTAHRGESTGDFLDLHFPLMPVKEDPFDLCESSKRPLLHFISIQESSDASGRVLCKENPQ